MKLFTRNPISSLNLNIKTEFEHLAIISNINLEIFTFIILLVTVCTK